MIFLFALIFFPFVTVFCEVVALIRICINKPLRGFGRFVKAVGPYLEVALFGFGVYLEVLYLELLDILLSAGWEEQLINNELHQPVNTDYLPTIITIGALFVVARLVLGLTKTEKTPPLWTVLSISALYAGDIFAIVFTIQLSNHIFDEDFLALYLFVIPVNMLLLTARIIVAKVKGYKPDASRSHRIFSNPFLQKCADIIEKAEYWPITAFILMWPLLGILLAILCLFGQAPDSIIKAFTETSDFVFSTKESPQNISADEHYLCTVAAGGDRKIVKPLRRGIRHGHEVTVNRQLCVANAFEQELEIHTPRFHRVVRNFYDKYGFPIARLIKKKWVADLVYFIMKPLEWIFVTVIYLTEVHPEDRIAIQYTGAGIAYEGDKVVIVK